MIPKCPKIIHYNWFGPIINKSDRENLVKNLKRTGLGENAWTSILWTASRFCDPKTYESNVAFVKELQKQKYNICVRSIDELDLTKEDEEMLQKLWKDTQRLRKLRKEFPSKYPGLRVTWIAAMSDFCRMLSIYKFGGIWADIGDTLFPKNFAIVWEKYGLDNMPGAGFRVAMNHSGIVRNPSQHLFAARIRAPIILAFIQRMRKLWKTRMCNIDIEDPKFDAISSTLAWTGMGGTTGPIMRSTPCDVDGKRTNVMDAWKMGFADVRMGKPIKGTKFCLIGRKEKDLIKTWSLKSWMRY